MANICVKCKFSFHPTTTIVYDVNGNCMYCGTISSGAMTNLDVAKAFIGNAIAYAKSGDMVTVLNNLDLIQKLLDNPNEENEQYDWEDFK